MSSLAAARADNFYHPPDWDPRKSSRAEHSEGGRKPLSKEDKWKAHPLRERAKKLATEGILTIRFEMPYNVRCLGCDNHIAKGVRFNAEKKTIGKYLSTNILSFRMMCHCEDGTSRTSRLTNPHWIEIHTDPKNAEYVVAEGAVRVSDPALRTPAELGVEATLDSEEADKRAANPFYRLEAAATAGPMGAAAAAEGAVPQAGHARAFGQRAGYAKPGQWLEALQGLRDADWEDDYGANRHLRRLHRAKRKSDFMQAACNEAKGIRVAVPNADHPADLAAAQAAPLDAAKRRKAEAKRQQPRVQLLAGSIFSGATPGLKAPSSRHKPAAREPHADPSSSSSSAAAAARRPPPPRNAAEQERLRLVQLRRERGMCITTSEPPHAQPPPPRQLLGATINAVRAAAKPLPAPKAASLVAYSDSDDEDAGAE